METLGTIFLAIAGSAIVVVALFTVIRILSSLGVTVYDYERVLLFSRGRLRRVLEPGLHFVPIPWRHLERTDMRSQLLSVPGQEVLTKDGLAFKLSVVVQYHVDKPDVAFLSTRSVTEQLHADAQLALREFVGSRDADAVMADREAMNAALMDALVKSATPRGIAIERAGLKDLMLPAPVRQVFQQVVEARKGAEASLERARGETAVLRMLRNAARAVDRDPSLLSLKALHTASSGRHTLVLQMPGAGTAPAGPEPEGDEENRSAA